MGLGGYCDCREGSFQNSCNSLKLIKNNEEIARNFFGKHHGKKEKNVSSSSMTTFREVLGKKKKNKRKNKRNCDIYGYSGGPYS